MSDLSATYMGIPLKSPIVVSACSISSYIDRIEMAERAGAGALVIRSLLNNRNLTITWLWEVKATQKPCLTFRRLSTVRPMSI